MRSLCWTAALAAVLLVPACGREPAEVPSPETGDPLDDLVLAEVGDRKIRVRDLLHKIEIQLPAMADAEGLQEVRQKRQVLTQMVDQYCWVQLAEEKGWDDDPEFRRVLELSRKYILANHSAERAVYSQAHPTPEEIKTYYVENADEFRLPPSCKASQIVVATEGEARELQRLLAQGADFAQLAQERSLDRTARSGGLLGTVAPGIEVKGYPGNHEIAPLILALGDREISAPVPVNNGWALFTAYEHTPERVRPLEEVSSIIEDLLFKKRSNELFGETLAKVREESDVVVHETAFITYAAGRLSDVELQAMAAAEPDAHAKIAYYEGLIKAHPNSPIAPQARFLAGFVRAEELKDFSAAKADFEEMIRNHPNDELVESARWMLANMGKELEGDPQLEQIRLLAKEKRKSR